MSARGVLTWPGQGAVQRQILAAGGAAGLFLGVALVFVAWKVSASERRAIAELAEAAARTVGQMVRRLAQPAAGRHAMRRRDEHARPGVARPAGAARVRQPANSGPYQVLVTAAVLVLVAVHLRPAGNVIALRSSPLYVMNVLFFAGASAGAIVAARFSQAVRLPGAAAFVTLAHRGALTGVVLAMIFVGLDVARQKYLWPLAWSIHFSPLDVMIVALYLGNALAVAYLASRLDLITVLARVPRGHRFRAMLALGNSAGLDRSGAGHVAFAEMLNFLLPAALLLESTPAWIMSRLGDESAWQATEISVLCYGSNVIAGLALAVGAALLSRGSLTVHLEAAAMHRLGLTLLVAIPILGYCLFGETRAVLAVKEPAATHLLQELVRGGSAVLFWSVLVVGVIVPFVLVWFSPKPTAVGLGVAAGLMSGAVLLERGTVAVALLLGHAHRLYSPGGYAPGMDEVVLTLGVYLVGLFTFLALARRA